ncbi:MAG: hypothetical protein ACO37W_03745 [Prochlorotrichaceae cyanobacterium]
MPGQVEEQARAWPYWSPDRNTWDAPGLGNHYGSIRKDQDLVDAHLERITHSVQNALRRLAA